MNKGTILAVSIFVATAILLVVGTVWPVPTAVYYAGGGNILQSPSTPIKAVNNLGEYIRLRQWGNAYNSLANKAEFSETAFVQDLKGHHLSLRTFATLSSVDVKPLHESADSAEMQMRMHWSTLVGSFEDLRMVHVVKAGDRWSVDWPLVKQPSVPPQVIPVNYLRWDIIYPGPEENWGAQGVAGPNVRIVDMRPVNRAEGVVVLGELMNDDVVPAWASVRATLLAKNGSVIASAGSFDMMSHRLLPKQVTPFLIRFPNVDLSQVSRISIDPRASLIAASADPVIEVENEKYSPGPDAALTGQIANQSGRVVNFSHVLSTFYDKNGKLVWVAGEYISRALPPKTPVDFRIPVPADLARQINRERTIVATYSPRSTQ
ncbi:MAG TPA: hypothetical protein VMU92_12520 [Acidobacteriaceae bacterium]|nr:hypothetical protein [Acidobacteriaceae bacterium]